MFISKMSTIHDCFFILPLTKVMRNFGSLFADM